jgi:glutamate-1-semialdehyde 2,1-aminomutase
MSATQALERWAACLGGGTCDVGADVAMIVGLAGAVVLLVWLGRRIAVALLTLRARAITPALSRWLSRWVKRLDHSEDGLLRADGAPEEHIARRRRGLERLADRLRRRFPQSIAWGDTIRDSFSDLRFTDANRVPFPFAQVVRERFNLCSVVTASEGPRLRDLDGQWTLDVSGAYGVNVAGFDRYKVWMQRGLERVAELGPVLGPLHPIVADNVAMLKRLSGLDEVSFHMSGTEAVMAAVRLARHNTRRRLIVCFSGAYHGWWDGVQPGLGSERDLPDCLTLKDMHPASLDVLRLRAREVAAVLVNPVQCFHPNSPPPSDAVLMTSEVRKTSDAETRYARWLAELQAVCTAHDVPLVFDEVYSGFRLAPGGAQAYFGVRADMVVYGKTVAGGMPIGVVCGRRDLMRRFDPDRPMRLAYVVGTFSAHPVVMGAMHEFLTWVSAPDAEPAYADANARCAAWVHSTNERLGVAGLPIRLAHLGSVWTVLFDEPGRFNWLLQYYLRAEGVTLSWVGTGRCLSSMDFTDADYAALQEMVVAAATTMRADGWWLRGEAQPGRSWKMRVRLVRELFGSLVQVPRPVHAFYADVMKRKDDDHDASHHDLVNQTFHLLSSSVFVFSYAAAFVNLTLAMWVGLPALFVRQIGHAVFEPAAHERERALLGFTTRSKTLIVLGYLLIPLLHLALQGGVDLATLTAAAPGIARHWFLYTLAVVLGRTLYLMWKRGARNGAIWLVKLATDPMTDLITYSPARLRRAMRPA